MNNFPDLDRHCYEDIFLGRHKSDLNWLQKLGVAVFMQVATDLRNYPWENNIHKNAWNFLKYPNKEFTYWSSVINADEDILRETMIRGLKPSAMAKLREERAYFRRPQAHSGICNQEKALA